MLDAPVPPLLRKQRELHPHVRPRVRVLAEHLGDDACILEVPETHIVGGHREPGAVGLRDPVRNLLAHLRQITCAGENALLRVAAVLDA